MRHNTAVRGNVDDDMIQRLEELVNGTLDERERLSLVKRVNQIDAGVLALSASVIGMVAASLSIYLRAKEIFDSLGRPPTISEVRERVENAAAEYGVVDARVVEIANFKMVPDRKRQEPCVVTIKDLTTGRYFDAFYYGQDRIEVIELTTS